MFDPKEAVIHCPKGCDVSTSPEPIGQSRFVCSACGHEFEFRASPSVAPIEASGRRFGGGRVSRGGLAFVLALCASAAWAQPQSAPLVQASDLVFRGSFTLPANDGAGTSMVWDAGGALSIAAEGGLRIGCTSFQSLARVSIPALGGTAAILDPCRGPSNISAVDPGDPNGHHLSGSLSWGGRVVVSAYAYYDGSENAVASHWAGPSLTALTGPVRVGSANPGFVGGPMTLIPAEWRTLLGGPALTEQCCIAIIGRSSLGPTASVFDPAQIGVVAPVPATMLVGYPIAHPTLGTYESSGVSGYNGGTRIGGMAFPVGTRSLLFIGRQGGAFCYGTGTTNKALHMTPNPAGDLWCYDPINGDKGGHAYPYRHQVWAYDANDLLAVKQGTKPSWEVVPYGLWTLPGMDATSSATMRGATYDPATRRLYVTQDAYGSPQTVYVYEIAVGTPPPPPPPAAVNCAGVWADALSAPTPLDCPATQQQTRTRTRTFTMTTPASNGGLACPVSPVVTAETSACVYVPPPPVPLPQFSARFRSQTLVTAGLRLTFSAPAAQALPAIGAAVVVIVDGVPTPGTVYDVDLAYYAGTPRETRIIVTLPSLTYLAMTVQVP